MNKFYYSLLKIIFLIIFIGVFIYGCAQKRLPALPVNFEPPILEITQAELKRQEQEKLKQEEKNKLSQNIDSFQNILSKAFNSEASKYALDRLKEAKNWLEHAKLLLAEEKFSEIYQSLDRVKLEIDTSNQQTEKQLLEEKEILDESKKKVEEEKKLKESEENKIKGLEAVKIREKTIYSELFQKMKIKVEKAITSNVNKFLPQTASKLNILINDSEQALREENYKKITEASDEIDFFLKDLEVELKLIIEKINGDEAFIGIKNILNVKNFGEAYFKARNFIRSYPDSKYVPEAYFIVGRCYEEFNNYDRSKETYTFIINNYPDSEWAIQARDHLDIDLKASFLKKANQSVSKEEKTSQETVKQVTVIQEVKPTQNASKAVNEAIKQINPITIQNNNVQTASAAENKEPGIKKTKEEIDLIYNEALDFLLKKKQADKAKEKFEYLITLKDKNILDNSLYWLGEAYYSEQNFNKALEYFNEAVNNEVKSGKDAACQFKIGLSYYNLKKFNESLHAFKILLDKYPKSDLIKKAEGYIQTIEKMLDSRLRGNDKTQ